MKNKSSSKKIVLPELILPADWVSVSKLLPLTLNPSKSELNLIHLYIPENALAGEYQLFYRLRDGTSKVLLAEKKFTLTVLPKIKINLMLIEAPKYCLAGEAYKLTYLAINEGNAKIFVELNIQSSDNLAFELLSPKLKDIPTLGLPLEPGQSLPIEIIIQTNKKIFKSQFHIVQLAVLKAWQVEQGKTINDIGEILAHSHSLVEIIPSHDQPELFMFTLPVLVTLNGFLNYSSPAEWLGGGFIAVLAKGDLDEDGKHKLEINLHKQFDSQADLFFNSKDRYSAFYKNDFLETKIGDFSYKLSPLINYFSFGRGIQLKGFVEPFSFGAYYYNNIWLEETKQEIAFFSNFTLTDAGKQLPFLYQINLNLASQFKNDFTFSIHQFFYPLPGILLELDLASSLVAQNSLQLAAYFRSQGKLNIFFYDFNAIYADPAFCGTLKDLYRLALTGGLDFEDEKLKLTTSFYLTENNLLKNQSLAEAKRVRFFQIQADYILPLIATNLSFVYANINSFDTLPDSAYDLSENIIQLRARQPFDFLSIFLLMKLNFNYDAIPQIFSFRQQYEGGIDWKILPSLNLGFLLSYEGSISELTANSDKIGFNLNTSFKLLPLSLKASLKITSSYLESFFQKLFLGLQLAGEYSFANQHKLSGLLNYSYGETPETPQHFFSLSFKYSVPFDLPLGYRKSVNILKGKLYNKFNGQGISNVVLRIDGLASTTDKNGNYCFYLTRAGEYFLTIERSRLGEDMIPDINIPLLVKIENQNQILDIPIVKASSLKVKIVFAELDLATQEPNIGLANILLELERVDETRRLLTNISGETFFEELRPGKWILKIISGKIPQYYYFENKVFEIDIEPGEQKELKIKVLKEKREIKLIRDDFITVELTPIPIPLDLTKDITVSSEDITPTPTP